jgi:starch phosphorylase
VEAGHDRFSTGDLKMALDQEGLDLACSYGQEGPDTVNLTLLAMNVSHSVNAVSRRHAEVMSVQFPKHKDRIKYVTNGVHPPTWVSEEMMKLLKAYPQVFVNVEDNPMIASRVQELKADPGFRKALWQAHQKNKERLCQLLAKWGFDKDVLTICWARRIAAYKRPSMIFNDISRLLDIAVNAGPLQIILAGKAHPNDNLAFTYINEMLDVADHMVDRYDRVKIVILENYEIYSAKVLVSSSDIWLNNPLPPFEASGTSGMKAIMNAVVQLSTVDGWVAEAEDLGLGRLFGWKADLKHLGSEMDLRMREDADALYKSFYELAVLYYKTNNKGRLDLSGEWLDLMINCIAAGARFNTYRMLDEYKSLIWQR